MNKKINILELNKIRNSIKQLYGDNEFRDLLTESNLLSITQPVFFDELKSIFDALSKNKVKGDIMEVGVWNGGTAIYMKALIEYYELSSQLWLFDTFDEKFCTSYYKHDKDLKALDKYLSWSNLIYPSVEVVIQNFNQFDLYDENVKILKGDIFDTYVNCDASDISLLRLDVDFFESTLFMLEKFYPKISNGGYIIIDDYGVEEFNCKDAVDKFRKDNKINNKLNLVGDFVAYWIKE